MGARLTSRRGTTRQLYECVMNNDDLQNTLQPIVHQYRQRTHAKGFHAYTNRPLTATTPPSTTSPKSQKSEPSSRSSLSSNSTKNKSPSGSSPTSLTEMPPPQTSPTPSSNSYESGMSIIKAFLDEERQKEATIQAHIETERQAICQIQFENERQEALRNMRTMPGSSQNPIIVEKDDEDGFPPLVPYQQ